MTQGCDLKGRQKLFLLHLGTAASCCRAYSDPISQYKNLNDLISQWNHERDCINQGIQVSNCETCWKAESQGSTSYRQLNQGNDTDAIELFLDNACNQMCSYCSPKFSSEWENSITKHGNFKGVSKATNKNFEITKADLDHDFWIDQLHQYIQQQPPNSVAIKLLGGEPLMQFKNLQRLLEFNSQRIRQLRINTNLNPPNNKFLLWLLDNVPHDRMFFDISLDTRPEFNHIPRAGFDQAKFHENLELIRAHGIGYCLLGVVSVLSVFDLANYCSWAKQHQHPLNLLSLNNPACLSPELIPDHFKQRIDLAEVPDHVQELMKVRNSNKIDIKLFEQYNYLTEYFHRAGIEPAQTDNQLFVEYWHWLHERFYENSVGIRSTS